MGMYDNLLAQERQRVATEAANMQGSGSVYLAAEGAEQMRQGMRGMLGIEEPVIAEEQARMAQEQKLNSLLSKYTTMETPQDYRNAINDLFANGFPEQAAAVQKVLNTLPKETSNTPDVSNDVLDYEYWKSKNPTWSDDKIYAHMRYLSAGDPIAEAKQIKNFEIQQKSINADLVNLEKEKKIADEQIQNLTFMKQLFEAGATTGYGEEYILSAKKAANRLFGANFETASAEALSVAFKNEALNQVQKLSGAASDKDIEFVEASRARLGLSPQANKLLIEYNLFLADKQSDMDDYMTDWVANNPEASYAQYKQEKNKWRNKPENFFNLENKMSLLGETSQDNITLEEQTKQNDIAFDALKAELEAAQNN